MGKKYKYTIITLFLALVFSFGSMTGMDFIMKAKERRLLEEGGSVFPNNSVMEWQERDGLTMEEMERVINLWENSAKLTAHNPVWGQISMEQAVKDGKDWLNEMNLVIDENGSFIKIDSGSVSAVLEMAEQQERDITQPQYSFWKVEFSNQVIEVYLYVNAVTGKVWFADITLFEYLPEQMPYWKLKDFVELAGLQASYKGATKNLEETEALWEIENSQVYAKMEFLHTLGRSSDSRMDEKEQPAAERIDLKESVNIKFKLTTGKDDSITDTE